MMHVNITPIECQLPKLHSCLGLVVFCGRGWRSGQRQPQAVVYLLKTYFSLSRIVSRVVVAVGDYEDEALVGSLGLPTFRCHPTVVSGVLPVGAFALEESKELLGGYERLFFTESDHVIYGNGLPTSLSDKAYLVPHRLERHYRGWNSRGQPTVFFDGRSYVLWNYPKDGEAKEERGGLFVASTRRIAYGGAWIAPCQLVRQTDFLPVPGDCPLEWSSHAMFMQHKAYKTACVTNFFVEHLSGHDNSLRDGGVNIEDYPGWW